MLPEITIGGFTISVYWSMYLLGIVAMAVILVREGRRFGLKTRLAGVGFALILAVVGLLGAKLLYSSPLDGRRGMEQLARQTAESCGGYYMDYFANDDNPEHHRRVTGPAILKATGGQIDAVVAGVGSGGTVTGVGEHIRAWHDHIKIVAVEPYESQAIGGGFVGKHGIPGLGAGFVPANYNPYVVDLVMAVTSGDAQRAAREVLLTDGIPACPSAGAVLFAARQLIEKGKARRPLCIFSGRVTYD